MVAAVAVVVCRRYFGARCLVVLTPATGVVDQAVAGAVADLVAEVSAVVVVLVVVSEVAVILVEEAPAEVGNGIAKSRFGILWLRDLQSAISNLVSGDSNYG